MFVVRIVLLYIKYGCISEMMSIVASDFEKKKYKYIKIWTLIIYLSVRQRYHFCTIEEKNIPFFVWNLNIILYE